KRSGIIQWLAAWSVATTNPVGTVSVWNGAFIESSIRWKARRPVGTVTSKMCDGRAAKVGPNRSEKGQMPTLLSRRVMKRELVKIPKQTRRGKFIKLRCIITFECGHKREYAASEAPAKYGRCVECGNG